MHEYAKTLQTIYKRSIKWEKDPIIHKNKNKIKKKKKQTNKQTKTGLYPGTGSPPWLGPLSRYNALPNELRGNFKLISNEWSTYCKENLHTKYKEKWPIWPKYDIF